MIGDGDIGIFLSPLPGALFRGVLCRTVGSYIRCRPGLRAEAPKGLKPGPRRQTRAFRVAVPPTLLSSAAQTSVFHTHPPVGGVYTLSPRSGGSAHAERGDWLGRPRSPAPSLLRLEPPRRGTGHQHSKPSLSL